MLHFILESKTKYLLINKKHFEFKVGTGMGLFTQRLKFPYEEASSSTSNALITGEKSSTSIEFPIVIEPSFSISKRIGIGIRSGIFATPQYLIQS